MMFQAYIVEFFATMFLVYVILATGNPLAAGATLALVMLLTHGISGGYINPAVTLVMSSAGQLPSSEVVPYCLAEVFGGLVALELYKRVKPTGVASA
jgi:aquaporin Z